MNDSKCINGQLKNENIVFRRSMEPLKMQIVRKMSFGAEIRKLLVVSVLKRRHSDKNMFNIIIHNLIVKIFLKIYFFLFYFSF